jgi:hypothetical protein
MQSTHCLFLFLITLLPLSLILARCTSCHNHQHKCAQDSIGSGNSTPTDHPNGEKPKCKAEIFHTHLDGSKLAMRDIEDGFVEVDGVGNINSTESDDDTIIISDQNSQASGYPFSADETEATEYLDDVSEL